MSDDAQEIVAEIEDQTAGRNTVAIGLALLLIGFAAGAISAALMTPKTGKQMRRSLRRKLDDAVDSVGDWREQAGDLMDKGSDLADKAAAWADAAREAAKEKVGPLRKKFRS